MEANHREGDLTQNGHLQNNKTAPYTYVKIRSRYCRSKMSLYLSRSVSRVEVTYKNKTLISAYLSATLPPSSHMRFNWSGNYHKEDLRRAYDVATPENVQNINLITTERNGYVKRDKIEVGR